MSNFVQMQKANRVITIPTTQKESYLMRGYNVISEDGSVKEFATGGIDISPIEHAELKAENAALKAEIEKLKSQRSRNNEGNGGNHQKQQHQNPRN